MALVCVHMLTLDTPKSNESCFYGKCSMELDLAPVLASVEVCIAKSEFAVLGKTT